MAKIFYGLIIFYLASFVSSTAGEEIFGAALFLIFLVDISIDFKKYSINSVLKKLRLGHADIPVLFFGFWALFCTYIIFQNYREVWTTFLDVRWILLLYSLSYLLKKYFKPTYQNHFKFILMCTTIVGVYGIIQMFTRLELVRPTNTHISEIGNFYRATGFFRVPLTFAYCIGMVGIFGFAAFLIQMKNKIRSYIFPLIAAIISIAAIIASSTRGAWIAIFIAIIITTYLVDKKKSIIVFLVSLVGAGLLMLEPSIKDRILSVFNTTNYYSNTVRIDLWKANLEIFKDHPITGVGLEKSKNHLLEYYQKLNLNSDFVAHAHNDFLNTISGVGLPGAIAWLWFCGYFIFLAYKLFKNSSDYRLQILTLGSLGAQIYMHIGGITQCNFYDNEVTHILVFIWALLLGIQYYYSNPSKQPNTEP